MLTRYCFKSLKCKTLSSQIKITYNFALLLNDKRSHKQRSDKVWEAEWKFKPFN